jgi:hypothetical protein
VTNVVPCADRTNDPQDWFIRSDGRQYSDDEFLDREERRLVMLAVLPREAEAPADLAERQEAAVRAAVSNRKRAALTSRRQAREACFECPIRLACLDQALMQNQQHGTWGGYFEEQLAEIRRTRDSRRRREQPIQEATS